ncbi:MAG: intradiol ring-cleavage dioxygenase [Pirellulales bacterium]
MSHPIAVARRREFLGTLAGGAAALLASTVLAEERTRTPEQTEGPFYPDHLPLDTDNDLVRVNAGETAATGEITHLTGKILDANGDPVSGVQVEIWQVDHRGVYLHTGDSGKRQRDQNFQGFGRFLTSPTGEYYFRTIKPVPYPGRTPHIHVKVKQGRRDLLNTQCYIRGEPRNERDGVYRGIRDAAARDSVTIDFQPLPGSKTGELAATFDIVLGFTPEG